MGGGQIGVRVMVRILIISAASRGLIKHEHKDYFVPMLKKMSL